MDKDSIRERLRWVRTEITRLQSEAMILERRLRDQSNIITMEQVQLFWSYFKGRRDVFSRRAGRPNPKTGKIGYYTQIDYSKKPEKVYSELRGRDLLAHLKGEKTDCSDVVGIYPILPDESCNFLVFDFDDHNPEDRVMSKRIKEEVGAVREICEQNGIGTLVERSRSGKGAHVWIFFEEPVMTKTAREFGTALINKGSESVNLKNFNFYDRMIPTQDHLPINRKTGKPGLGNMVALPLQGRAMTMGNSVFVDEKWNAYDNQWEVLAKTKKLTKEFVEEKIFEWGGNELSLNSGYNTNPWEKERAEFCLEDVEDVVEIVLANQLYIKSENLRPRLQNQIRRMATFANQEYYKKYAMGFSTAGVPRIIFCGYDENGYICIPRGLLEKLIINFDATGIKYVIIDKREKGQKIKVKFAGKLYPEQKEAIKELGKYENGILSATTAFGKTVVGARMIAKHNVNTLILVHSTEIMNNWLNDLENFLDIKEDPPYYKTPTGRRKQRKSVFGKITSTKKAPTSIVDVAMISSLGKPDDIDQMVNNYGMVIVDECHHGPSRIANAVIMETKARYLYGFTATPKRNDGQEKRLFMEFGDVRYEYTAKDRMEKTGVKQILIPRMTEFDYDGGKKEIQDIYKKLVEDERRNKLIVDDILRLYREKRSILVVTKFKKQAKIIYEGLSKNNNIFLFTGELKMRDREAIRKDLESVPVNEAMVLVATGQLIGEGFNCPRLDTMLLATPIAWEGNVEQYVGRLHRAYTGKSKVEVYDYIDKNVPVLKRMYEKRLRAYRKIGYTT